MSRDHDPPDQARQQGIRQEQRYLQRKSGPYGRGVTGGRRIFYLHLCPALAAAQQARHAGRQVRRPRQGFRGRGDGYGGCHQIAQSATQG
jgi:hypothetical protein